MHLLLRALLLLLASGVLWTASIAPALVYAQAQALHGKRIVDVSIDGDAATLITRDELGLPVGATLSRQLVREMIQRLIASERWTDVQVDAVEAGDGVTLNVHLVARATLSRLDVRGADDVDVAEITRELDLLPGAQLSSEVVDAAREQILATYAERGYRQASAVMTVRDTDDATRKVLLVEIEEGAPTTIARITVHGDRPLDPRALIAALPFSEGDVLDGARVFEGVRRAERRLRKRGYLEATLGEPQQRMLDGARAEVVIDAHVGPLYRVEIAGQEPLERNVVLSAMEIGEEPLSSQVQLSAVAERVVDTYRRRGFVDAQVKIETQPDRRPGRAFLRVRVTPGTQLEVMAIGFPGARHFDRGFLEDQIVSYLEEELPGAGMFAPVDSDMIDDVTVGPGPNYRTHPVPPHANPARTYYEPTYAAAIQHLEQLYQAEGFLSARIGPAVLQRTAQTALSARGAVVAIPITEGPRTMLHAVTLIGNEALGAQELASQSGLRRAMPFSYLALEEAKLRIVQLYKERGYLYAKVEPAVRFSQDRTRAEVTIEIVERYQVQVESIVIKGAERTDEDLIRDLVELHPGDIYRPSIAQESEERLLGLGVFSGVTIAPEDAELPARSKRVEVSVTQRASQVIDFKAGVSTGQGVRGGFEYGYRDLFGQAISLTLRAELAYQFLFFQKEIEERYDRLVLQDRLERNVTLSLVIPQMIRLVPLRTSIEIFHVRDNQRAFGLDKNGVGFGFSYQPMRRLTLAFNTDLENNNIDLFIDAESIEDAIEMLMMSTDPRDQAEALFLQRQRVPDGDSYLVAGRLSASYDRRDNPLTPTRGFFGSLATELATTLQTEQAKINSRFLKVSATINGYLPLGKNVVFAVQARAGYIIHLLPHCITQTENVECSQTYPNRAFFMGGVDTMRGYYQDAMVPQDQVASILQSEVISPNAFVLSGDAFILYRAELRFPLLGALHGATFADLGNLWANPRLIDPFQVRASVGAGIRFSTPVGPLAFDYGIVLGARRELVEPKWGTVHFSMGLF